MNSIEYIVYPQDIAESFNPSCRTDALHVLLQHKEYRNWIVSVFDIGITKSGDLQYNYEVISVPQNITEIQIESARDELSVILTDVLLNIFDRLSEKQNNNDEYSINNTTTTDE